MTLKLAQFCDDPKKYQQNFHTQNNIHFSEKPQNTGVVVFGQNICYHVAAFGILFKLICNMTMFRKAEF